MQALFFVKSGIRVLRGGFHGERTTVGALNAALRVQVLEVFADRDERSIRSAARGL